MTEVVRVEAMMAPATSRVPMEAASFSDRPFSSRCRIMFSKTTIALSTIRPTPRASPPNVIWFNVRSLKNSRANVAMIEMGIDSAMMNVVDPFRRNRYSTRMARREPQIAEFWTLLIDLRIKSLWSLTTVSLTSERVWLMRSTSARMLSATVTVLAPLCFWMSRRTTGTPFSSAIRSRSS